MGEKFYTQKGYTKKTGLSSSKEDYLEMIYRICVKNGFARMSEIGKRLNVSTSSASKMAIQLRDEGLISYKKYGIITLTEVGHKRGEYLVVRHKILNEFFCYVNKSENELLLTEQIEHFFNPETIKNLENLLNLLKSEG